MTYNFVRSYYYEQWQLNQQLLKYNSFFLSLIINLT